MSAMPRTGHARIILMHDSCVWDSFAEVTLLSVMGSVGIRHIAHSCAAQESDEPFVVIGQTPVQNDGHCASSQCMQPEDPFCSVWNNTSCCCDEDHSKCATCVSILHAEASFSSAERGL